MDVCEFRLDRWRFCCVLCNLGIDLCSLCRDWASNWVFVFEIKVSFIICCYYTFVPFIYMIQLNSFMVFRL